MNSDSAPLRDMVVADFGVGMAAALAAKFLAEAGAEVRRIEPAGGDPFADVYPAYATWRSCLASVTTFSAKSERELLMRADLCIIGGEDFPGVATRHDADQLAAAYPGLVVLDIVATLPESGLAPLHGADILVQARSGLVFETYPDRPALMGFAPSAYGAMLTGLTGAMTALYQRQTTGAGQIVRAGLLEGALTWAQAFWGRAENPTPRFSFTVPKGARPLIFQTRDGAHVHVVLGSTGAKAKLYKVLGVSDPSILPDDPGLPDPTQPPEKFFGDLDLLAPFAAEMDSADLLGALEREGVVAEVVLAPGALFDDAQAAANGIFGRSADGIDYVGLPVRWQGGEEGGLLPRPRAPERAPLEGIRVVDFGAFIAGPAASVGLADLGADVIKIEPMQGDPIRGNHGFFAAANRGKRSIAIDLKKPAGLALAHRLAERADVVCSNFRVGVAERLGIDAATLHITQPEKIVLHNAGYGSTGPKVTRPAFDPCMQASCGIEARGAGDDGGGPVLNRLMIVDFCGALLGELGVLIALYRRAASGGGAAITVPLLNAGLFLTSDVIRCEHGELVGARTLLPDQTGFSATEKLYRTKDGWIAVAARGEAAAAAFAHSFGLARIAARPWQAWGAAEAAVLADVIGCFTTAEALMLLDRASVPAARCEAQMAEEFIANDHLVTVGRVYEAERGELGKVRGLGRLYSLSSGLPRPRGELAKKGQQGREIMREAGLSVETIDKLYADKVVSA